jgi:hypothetical protein
MDNNESSELPTYTEEKKRHGCLSVYLILIILGSSFTTLGNFSGLLLNAVPEAVNAVPDVPAPVFPSWVYLVLGIFGLINIVSAFAIFKWKKWGFWLFTLTGFLTCFINISAGLNILSCVIGLSGLAILYGVLQIGGDKKGWAQLD